MPAKRKILSLNLGEKHNDFEATKNSIIGCGYDVEELDVSANGLDTVRLSEYAAVELRNCRNWQINWNTFEPVLRQLEEAGIRTIPDTAMFRWVLNKAAYIAELREKGVRTIPTAFVSSGDSANLTDYLNERNQHHVVLKPERGSRAKGVRFIKMLGEDRYQVTTPSSPSDIQTVMSKDELNDFFKTYLDENNPNTVLIQDYIPDGKEISSVKIGNELHYVETTKAENHAVAHDEYGGKNNPIEPTEELQQTVSEILKRLPDDLLNSPYVRLDTITTENGEIYLLEIEGGTPRLFLQECNKFDHYGKVVDNEAKKSPKEIKKGPIKNVAIIGGGLAGASMMAGIVQEAVKVGMKNLNITIYEKSYEIGAGFPYATNLPNSFLLNHEMDHMGSINIHLDKMEHDDFAKWVQANQDTLKPLYPDFDLEDLNGYVPRKIYGRYLNARYKEAKEYAERHGIKITEIHQAVTDVKKCNDGFCVEADNASSMPFDKVVLSTGNWYNPVDPELQKTGRAFLAYDWQSYLTSNSIPNDATMLIRGSGLAAYDIAVEALESGKYKKVVMCSRTGNLREVRGITKPYARKHLTIENLELKAHEAGSANFSLENIQELLLQELEEIYGNKIEWKSTSSIKEVVSHLNENIERVKNNEELKWRSLLASIPDEERHKIFNGLSEADQKRAFEQYFSLYQCFLAPMPLPKAEKLSRFIENGQLELVNGAQEVTFDEDSKKFTLKFAVDMNGRMISNPATGQCQELDTKADVYVIAVGSSRDIEHLPLYRNMIENGLLEKHRNGGINANYESRHPVVNGREIEDIVVIGSVFCGPTPLTHNSLQTTRWARSLSKDVVASLADENTSLKKALQRVA